MVGAAASSAFKGLLAALPIMIALWSTISVEFDDHAL
jgi:hypothetical protein